MRKLTVLLNLIISLYSYGGRADTIHIYSPSMKKYIPCVVIQPESYQKREEPLPVVYLLHGYGSNYSQWPTVAPQLKVKADELHLLIVCPDGGFGSWYFNSTIDSSMRYETFIVKELVNYIDSHYRTFASRNFRAITGLSMGGHGGLYLGIRYRNIFGAAGSTSGVVDFPSLINKREALEDGTERTYGNENPGKNSVMNWVDSLKNGEIRLIIDCGTSDWLIYVNRKLHQKLLSKKIDHDYTERPGKHNSAYWDNSIDYQLLFFKKYFDEEKK